ncbi:hypothetical protein [Pseudomonas sp. GM21]|uniref:hypothetical protein n=1 Tax=Pseudomonas sp. GM21 TaxID=1144325 RepID=UPI0012FCBE8D|nr:hypothetical protein [Pseudomonas sp. GM21]
MPFFLRKIGLNLLRLHASILVSGLALQGIAIAIHAGQSGNAQGIDWSTPASAGQTAKGSRQKSLPFRGLCKIEKPGHVSHINPTGIGVEPSTADGVREEDVGPRCLWCGIDSCDENLGREQKTAFR